MVRQKQTRPSQGRANMARLVIGLDFGTTYSEGTSGIHLITQWPGISGASNNEKVPSKIVYGPNGELAWGNQIRYNTKHKVHAYMKLKLDEVPDENRRSNLDGLMRSLQGDGSIKGMAVNGNVDTIKQPVDIICDYLSALRESAYDEMAKCYGDEMFSSMAKELVITVPAVWSERAKDLTIKAVNDAKFNPSKVMLVSEPEAAAVYTLKGMMEGVGKADIKVGDVFVLCDAGGGTVDLISYKIMQVEPCLEIQEAAVGTGGKCGASYLDEAFLGFLERWIGSDAFQKIKPEKLRPGSQMMTAFDTAKFQFNGEDVEMDIQLPSECDIGDDAFMNIEDNVLTLRGEHMAEVFKPCVGQIIGLIDGQISSVLRAGHGNPKMVLVVGGFGRNGYLYRMIKEYCTSRGIETRQPVAPWSAIARGAVCRGLESHRNSAITMRLARKFYGIKLSEIYDPSIHDPRDKFIDEYTGETKANGQMTWLCAKGDPLSERKATTMSFSVQRDFFAYESRTAASLLIGCEQDNAPRRYADESAVPICKVHADFSDIPLSEFRQGKHPLTGKVYYSIIYTLEATFEPAHISWKLIHRGRVAGSTTVSYDK